MPLVILTLVTLLSYLFLKKWCFCWCYSFWWAVLFKASRNLNLAIFTFWCKRQPFMVKPKFSCRLVCVFTSDTHVRQFMLVPLCNVLTDLEIQVHCRLICLWVAFEIRYDRRLLSIPNCGNVEVQHWKTTVGSHICNHLRGWNLRNGKQCAHACVQCSRVFSLSTATTNTSRFITLVQF